MASQAEFDAARLALREAVALAKGSGLSTPQLRQLERDVRARLAPKDSRIAEAEMQFAALTLRLAIEKAAPPPVDGLDLSADTDLANRVAAAAELERARMKIDAKARDDAKTDALLRNQNRTWSDMNGGSR